MANPATGVIMADLSACGQLLKPQFACFARRGCLFVTLEIIELSKCLLPAHSSIRHRVLWRHSGASCWKTVDSTLEIACIGCANGLPAGLRFTSDGTHIMLCDALNARVSKFNAASGELVSHVVTREVWSPTDVLLNEDGGHVRAFTIVLGRSRMPLWRMART
jgi:hypothetical protein